MNSSNPGSPMFWIASFVVVCGLLAGWSVIRDQAEQRKRRLERIQRRIAEKERATDAE